ncbi:MAG: S53 family peptidase [Solirubrobacterales bacterium]
MPAPPRPRVLTARRVSAPGLAAILAALALALAGGASGSVSGRVGVPGAVPSWASGARQAGSPAGPLDFSVVLGWRHRAALERFDREVSDPASPRLGRFLSPARFRARFAPTPARVSAVRRWLRRSGLAVTGVSRSRMLVDASGPVQSVERALGTRLALFRHGGRRVVAPSRGVSVPAGLGIAGVVGLDGSQARPLRVPPPPVFRNIVRPCSNFWGRDFPKKKAAPFAFGQKQPWAPCGYAPKQVQGAYGVGGAIRHGNDGRGQTVAIIDAFASPTIRRDIGIYSRRHGLPRARMRQVILQGNCKSGCPADLRQGWWGEETLDFDAVHSIAPGARILYVGAPNPGPGLLRAEAWVVDRRAARIVTNSWGSLGEFGVGVQAYEQVFAEAIAEGIGIYFSSGDSGDERDTIGRVSSDYPASSPRVTSVGGTTLAVGPLDNFRFELGWGTYLATKSGKRWDPRPPGDFLYGAGGGTSRFFAEPRYQRGVVPHGIAARYGGAGRVSPDISMDADPTTGLLVGETQTLPSGRAAYDEARYGGTSLSSPLMAGYMALADQRAGRPHGFVNPALYALYGTAAIRDVRPPRVRIAMVRRGYANGVNKGGGIVTSLRTVGPAGVLRARRGYDPLTGLGSPRGRRLLRALGD